MAPTAKNDDPFMLLAINAAKRGIAFGQSPFGSCIIKGNRIIACAHNSVWKKTNITAHAEVEAIRLACKKLKSIKLSGCIIYTTCEPCPMCYSAIHWAGIQKIVYGATIGDAKKCGFGELEIPAERMKRLSGGKIKIEKGVMREECAALFTLFNKKWGKSRLY